MAITMGALFQALETLQGRIGEVTEYNGNYDSASEGTQADWDATDVAEAFAFHLKQVVDFLEYTQKDDAANDSDEMKKIQFRLAHSAIGITTAIAEFDDPPEEEEEDDESESDESEEA